ncbi:hypothetical protein PP501_gp40 [Gordonia phage Powerball]|uniref:DUF3800 domain-containing protein n=1 Tax=Gordonia phage Powerball TaxID=2599847 RepID=A0A5J6TYL2_9CAUD|nr:hypothetical protein PP501_gp40 [Gordonia phage Powerball]QFG13472.1 hypothetical protein PBI_POWERBALL_40 [Gordonia phage Powerball]
MTVRTAKNATFFIDESGAKASSGTFFVVAGIKTKQPGRLQRSVEALRDATDYRDEFKFARINRDRKQVFRRLVETVAASDARIIATVVDRSSAGSPFRSDDEEWQVHARIVAQLINGNLSRGEYVAALLDNRSTKPNVSFGDTVRGMANHYLSDNAVVSAVTVDSRANDLLQVADLIAGSIGYQRKNPRGKALSHKGHVAYDLAQAFGVRDFSDDTRHGRVNVMTLK